MRKITVFNNVTLDGYFASKTGDMSWAHKNDPEWTQFAASNAGGGGGELLFGRVTYEMMARYWPGPEAMKQNPEVAKGMNALPKVVFSRSLDKATWANTKLVKGDLLTEVRKLKQEPGKDMVILGSGTIVSQLSEARLIDHYQIVVNPVVLGGGRTLFEGLTQKLDLERTETRAFGNGNVLLTYDLRA
jgi:dihydrofolate reductase